MKKPQLETVTVAEAAAILGVSERRVRALLPRLTWERKGKRLILIEKASLENVKDRQPGRPRESE